MKKTKHTPGPWELSDCGQHILGQVDQDEIIEVADLSNALNYKANAYLIAAAPEMLEALENLVSDSECPDHIAAYLLPVIAKARGEA